VGLLSDPRPDDQQQPVKVGFKPRGVAFSADGTRAYVTNSDSNAVTVIDTGL
jgi:DNA-binding beta-propeller fold protein YncE